MANKIRVLTEETINKIAAGEVIENAASVIKELVENSLDAGSMEICVEIVGGGRQLIRITDDGCGMDREDALLSLERHATSKIAKADELEQLSTLGFRGEAIPTIAAISQFTLLTSTREQKEATMVIVDGGRIVNCCSAERHPGTTIEVKDLFFNVPARRKFQKSPAQDVTEITKILSNLALAYPEISFRLISDQRSIVRARAVDNFSERMEEVLGKEFFKQCVPVSYKHRDLFLQGFIGLPLHSRANRMGQHLFINRRFVTSLFISHLVREAYGTALPSNRHPIFALKIDVPGEFVDVNVHPQKREVRLRQHDLFRNLLIRGLGKALQQDVASSDLSSEETQTLTASLHESTREGTSQISTADGCFEHRDRSDFSQPLLKRTLSSPQPLPWEIASSEERPEEEKVAQPLLREESPPEPYVSMNLQIDSTPQVIATFKGYILIEPSLPQKADALFTLVDQRAAHHRILFERLQKGSSAQVQPLLVPLPLEFSTLEVNCIRSVATPLKKLGIEIEEFGQNTFLVRAIPSDIASSDIAPLLSELVEQMTLFSSESAKELERERRLSFIASKRALKSRSHLSKEEAQYLIKELFTCENSRHCPQGNPIMITLHEKEIAKKFI